VYLLKEEVGDLKNRYDYAVTYARFWRKRSTEDVAVLEGDIRKQALTKEMMAKIRDAMDKANEINRKARMRERTGFSRAGIYEGLNDDGHPRTDQVMQRIDIRIHYLNSLKDC
jgi:DNA-binding phage protein